MCVCDTIARPMVQNFKQFNGHYGCCSCLHPGHKLENKIVYPLIEDITCRTHVETLQHAEKAVQNSTAYKGVKGPSHLVLLKHFDVVESFPPEYMHCVLLGVVRQLTELMFNSAYHDNTFYLGGSLKAIDSELTNLKPPNEIKRSPRSLVVRKFWKASEWRTYLLFYSPIVLKGKATREIYAHWLLLVNAMHLLLGQNIAANDITEAKHCFYKFVFGVRSLYGVEHCSCNVHLLTHLGDVAENWGPLWASSAFVYEDASGRLLKMFHGTQPVRLQIFKRFFATRKLREVASVHMCDAAEDIVQLFERISSLKQHSVKRATKVDDLVALGSVVSCKLSVAQCIELETLLDNPVSNDNCQIFDRFCFSRQLFSTNEYCLKFKRNNSFIQLKNNSFGVIKQGMFCKPHCVCETGTCNCNPEAFLVLSKVNIVRSQKVYNSFVEFDLFRCFIKVELGHNIFICRPRDIAFKCIVLKTQTETYVTRLLKVDLD